MATLLPTINQLTERQHQLFFLFHAAIARHVPEGLARLTDADVADAAQALASTLETAAKGVIYEHQAQTVTGKRLAAELSAMLADLKSRGVRVFDREAAITLRAIEQGARDIGPVTGGDTAYLTLMARLLQFNAPGATDRPQAAGPSLILP